MDPNSEFLIFRQLQSVYVSRLIKGLRDSDDGCAGSSDQTSSKTASAIALISYVQTGQKDTTRPRALDCLLSRLAADPSVDWNVWIDELGNASPHVDWWMRAVPLLYGQVMTIGE